MYNRATSRRLLYTLFVTQSLASASQIAIFTLIAIVAVRLSGTESLSGMPSSVLTFAQALAAFPLAAFMGRFGRRIGLSLGYFLIGLGSVVGVLAISWQTFPLLLVSAALLGIGRAGSDQSRFAAGDLFPEAERARMIGRIVFAGTIGAIVGPMLAPPSSQFMAVLGVPRETGPWAIAAVFCALSFMITFFLLRPDPMAIAHALAEDKRLTQTDLTAEKPARPVRALLTLPGVQLGMLAMLIGQTVMVVLMVMTPLHMDHLHHVQEAISGVIMAHTLGMFGLSALTGYLIDRFGRVPMIAVGALTLLTSALLAPLSSSEYVLAAALFLLGLGWNFCFVAGSSLLADALQGKERASVQGINDALVFFVAGIGSLGAGPLFSSGGYAGISLAGIGLTLVLLVLTFWLSRPRLAAVKTA